MEMRKETSLAKAGLAASLIAAVGASICCIGPLFAALFGMTSLAALVKYESLRPLFAVVTIGMLVAAFYLSYRKRPDEECAPDSVCATDGNGRIKRINRIVLWTAAVISIAVLTFPTWSGWVLK